MKDGKEYSLIIVQALASQGNEIGLINAFTTMTVHQLTVSPLFRGTNPYPCGSLTYRLHPTVSIKKL